MSDVTLSKAVRSNLLHLQNTAKMMDVTQERLATGKKVNSALDNPTNFFTAASLNARAADIGTLLDSMSNGIQTIEAADNGLTAITKTIESMQSTLRQARQDKTFQVQSFNVTADSVISFSGGAFDLPPEDLQLAPADVGEPARLTAPSFTPPNSAENAKYTFEYAEVGVETNILVSADAGGASSVTIAPNRPFADALADLNGALSPDFTATSTEDGVIEITATDPTVNAVGVQGTGGVGTASNVVSSPGNGTTETSSVTFTYSAVDAISTISVGGNVINLPANATIAEARYAIQSVMGSDYVVDIDADTGSITVATTNPSTEVITVASAGGTGTASNGVSAPRVAAQQLTFSLSYDNKTVPVTITGGTEEEMAQQINQQIESLGVTASFENGDLLLTADTADAKQLTVTGDDSDIFSQPFDLGQAPVEDTGITNPVDRFVSLINNQYSGQLRASNDNGKLRIENLSTEDLDVSFNDQPSQTIGGNDIRANLAKQFNELRSELDRLAEDASYNGINLLRGDALKIVFNELGTSQIEIQTRDAKGNTRPINSNELGLFEIEPEQLDDDASIDELLAGLQLALGEVRSQASDLGSTLSTVQNREKFTKEMINTLETGAANLTLADTNEEGANMLALQTRQQLSQTALSLASQADQAVLRLFG